MDKIDYWKECISISAEDCGIELSDEQLLSLAEGAMYGHENIGMAFYTPPSTDRIDSINSEWEAKYKLLEEKFDKYKERAEKAIGRALNQYSDASISINEDGVYAHDGRTTRIQ